MNLALLLCAAMLSSPTIVVSLDCETLAPPVVAVVEVESPSGSLLDWVAVRGCPPDTIRWAPNAAPPFVATVYVYEGPLRRLASKTTARYP